MKQFTVDMVVYINKVPTCLSKEMSWDDAVARFGRDKVRQAIQGEPATQTFAGGVAYLVRNSKWDKAEVSNNG
jgi:hypothetical protein